MDRTEIGRLEQLIDREARARFLPGAVLRVAVLQHGDDPVIEPGELMVRVFVETGGRSADGGSGGAEQSLRAWADAHEPGMRKFRRELSLRLPPARLLEFTVEQPGSSGPAPRITLPHDQALADEPVPGREIAEIAAALVRTRYVFPDRGEQAAAAIESGIAAGEYDDLSEAVLADRLTSQLFEICRDRHLRVKVSGPRQPRPAAVPADAGPPDPAKARRPQRPMGRLDNFGIHRVQRLDGNIGYLDVRRVALPENAGPAIAAAMELVAGTYALIIDLRRNGGGSPDGVVFWCSYFFAGPGTHFNDIFEAESGETRQFWSLSYVPGERYTDRPVYLLTSSDTFSGGEDFCYTLQALGRAQLIGETTGGGAHPTSVLPISLTMTIGVPCARSVNPVTGTNWEGTGVVPDIPVPATDACDVAYGHALRHVLTLDVPPPVADEARAALAALRPAALGPTDQQ